MDFIKNTFIPHKKNKYRPHLISHVGIIVSILLIFGVQIAYNNSVNGSWQVLGYATSVDSGSLLTLTNQNRAANSQSNLVANSQLTSAAQAKAQHMIDNNYWAHVAPDGTTPWSFINSAGYTYLKAGENLAYGYSTSADAVQGWMDSPTHRANILTAEYKDVGFGIANGANFQGGENTVIVALYGNPVGGTPPATPSPVVEQPTTEPSTPEIPAETTPEPTEQTNQADDEEDTPTINIPALTAFGNDGGGSGISQEVSNLEAILNGKANWSLYFTSMILVAIGSIYMYRHLIFLQTVIVRGEHIMHAHPLLEASMIYLVIWVVLTAQYGVIQ